MALQVFAPDLAGRGIDDVNEFVLILGREVIVGVCEGVQPIGPAAKQEPIALVR